MKNKIAVFVSILIIFICFDNLFALSTRNVAAFPVPFNPKNGTKKYLTIKDVNGLPTEVNGVSINRVVLEIFDINGDSLFKKSYNVLPVYWNGRNENGRLVKPGFYIIKVTVQNISTDEYGKKLIRILVAY